MTGSLAFDRILDYPGRFRDKIQPKKTHVLSVSFFVPTIRIGFGGTAGNIAYTLSLLGEHPVVVGSVGHDAAGYERWLRRHGVRLSLRRIKNSPTASVTIITDKDDNQISAFHPGAMEFPAFQQAQNHTSIHATRLIVSAPGNKTDSLASIRWAKSRKVSWVVDPGQRVFSLSRIDYRSIIRGAFLVIANDYEMLTIQKLSGWSASVIAKMADIVVTTLGRRGSLITRGNRTFRIPAGKPKTEADPTGAGDAFRAGLIAGLRWGLTLPSAGRLASVVSCYTVEQYGTQTHRFTLPSLNARYRKTFGTSFLAEKGRVDYAL